MANNPIIRGPKKKDLQEKSWMFMLCPKCKKWYYAETKGDYYCLDCHEPVKFDDELGIKIVAIPGIETTPLNPKDLTGKVLAIEGEQVGVHLEQHITISCKIYEDHAITGFNLREVLPYYTWRFNTVGKYLLYLILLVVFYTDYTLLGENYWRTQVFTTNLLVLVILSLSFVLNGIFPKKNMDFVNKIREIFVGKVIFDKFLNQVRDEVKKPLVRVVPVILALVGVGYNIYSASQWGFGLQVNIGGVVQPAIPVSIPVLLHHILFWAIFFIMAVFVLSAVFAFLTIVLNISAIGKDRFRIKVTYMDIKIGVYQELGVYPLSVGLLFIISGTAIGMLGYYYLVILNSITGIFFFGVMIALDGIAIFCIFYTTVTVHRRIVEFKNELIKRLKEYINQVLEAGIENVDFQTLRIMDKFCDEVNEINDWPLNPASFKKIAVSLFSAGLPAVLTMLGLTSLVL